MLVYTFINELSSDLMALSCAALFKTTKQRLIQLDIASIYAKISSNSIKLAFFKKHTHTHG